MAKGPGLLREMNEKRTLSFLRQNKTSSRQELADVLDVSKNTISLMIDRFIRDGLVREVGLDQSGVGRPRMQLSLISDAHQSAGILIRDERFEIVVTDYCGEMLESRQLPTNARDQALCLTRLSGLCNELIDKYPGLLGIGIAVPGLVDPVNGVVHYSSHLGWRNVAVTEFLSPRVSVPVHVLNRVKAAALSPLNIVPEHAESTFYIRIDEGVGGAFLIGNDIVHGASRTAGEIGHIVVRPDGPLCTCGRHGCLESVVSTSAILQRLGKTGLNSVSDEQFSILLESALIENGPLGLEEQTMENAGRDLGTAIATIINLFNPQYVVVDSPYNAIRAFKEAATLTAGDGALPYPFQHTEIIFVRTSLSSAWGMALAMIHQFETPNY